MGNVLSTNFPAETRGITCDNRALDSSGDILLLKDDGEYALIAKNSTPFIKWVKNLEIIRENVFGPLLEEARMVEVVY